MSVKNYDGPSEFKPIGAWGYFGLTILYAIPIIGWIFLIIFTFSGGNINRRSFTRSYWCWLLIAAIIFGGMFFLGKSQKGEQLAEDILEKISGLGLLSSSGSISEIVSSARSYEEIYNTYSERIKAATPNLIEEYKTEAAQNTAGITGLADLASKKVNKLAEISAEGTQRMAQHMLLKGSNSADEYEKWATKLNEDYLNEGQKIMDVYMNLAVG